MLDRLADWRALALARVALAPLWDVLSYGIGLTKLRFRTYLAVAIVGDLIPSMILVAFGSSAAELGMAGAGTAGARAAETALPIALPMVTAGLGAVLLIVVGLVLRPRLGHLLVRPVRPTVGQSERAVNAAHEGRIDQSHAA